MESAARGFISSMTMRLTERIAQGLISGYAIKIEKEVIIISAEKRSALLTTAVPTIHAAIELSRFAQLSKAQAKAEAALFFPRFTDGLEQEYLAQLRAQNGA